MSRKNLPRYKVTFDRIRNGNVEHVVYGNLSADWVKHICKQLDDRHIKYKVIKEE